MRLLIDIGNTRIKWAYDNGAELVNPGSMVHRDADVTAVADLVAQLPVPVTSAVAVNVAGPQLEVLLREALQQRFGIELQLERTADRSLASSSPSPQRGPTACTTQRASSSPAPVTAADPTGTGAI